MTNDVPSFVEAVLDAYNRGYKCGLREGQAKAPPPLLHFLVDLTALPTAALLIPSEDLSEVARESHYRNQITHLTGLVNRVRTDASKLAHDFNAKPEGA